MTDLLGTGIGVVDVGLGSFVVILLGMLFTDRLITKGRHDEVVELKRQGHARVVEQLEKAHADAIERERRRADDAEKREAKAWEVADAHDARAELLAAQVAQLTGGMGTVVDVLSTLRTLAERNAGGGSDDPTG